MNVPFLSFPRRRESRIVLIYTEEELDSRLSGNDKHTHFIIQGYKTNFIMNNYFVHLLCKWYNSSAMLTKHHIKKIKHKVHRKRKKILISLATLFLIFSGILVLWISSFKMPDLGSFDNRVISQSTKIYDRTGKILLYDVFENKKRTDVPFENISLNIKNATVAIEDEGFYQHNGIKISSFMRAVFANLLSGSFGQGGSTITQQVIKNSLLTTQKTITRKVKEWVLALRLEKVMTKEQILSIYLNENPYGGSIYGVEEASEEFFGKNAQDVTLGESAYLAAIPKAPTFYSPYGLNKDKLDERQKLVLSMMLKNNFINQEQYDSAIKEKVVFLPQEKFGIKAPHFVEYIKQYLANKYGDTSMQQNGYKVITTIDYNLQSKAEEIVKKYALDNEKNFNAENAAMVAIDPKTGQILAMVGSRDYFDKDIDGNFNVTMAYRQPGSTFKPFVYATAFMKGYTPDTVVFDLPTEFQSTCTPEGIPKNINAVISSSTECYMPENYDGLYLGPISLRNALAQSRNVPAIKTLYLAGINDSIETATAMGVKGLSDANQYGLTLVLGGGEVSLLDITSAYGTFANDGIRNPYTGILSVQDSKDNIIEQYNSNSEAVISANIAETISDVLSDNVAKIPAYGANSPLFFKDKQVASKTGTTNDYKDAWTIGYTPEIVIGAWAGNNNNTPMEKKVAGMIIAPMWHEIMAIALQNTTGETFKKPEAINPNLKPALKGIWQGNETYTIDKISGKLATDMTPEETKQEVAIPNVHSILFWVDKNNPMGPAPINPADDSQFESWEYAIQKWLLSNPLPYTVKPTGYDDIHTVSNKPRINLLSPFADSTFSKDSRITTIFTVNSNYIITKADLYFNDELVGTSISSPFSISFIPSSTNSISSDGNNNIKIVVSDSVYNKGEISIPIIIRE
jgi:1A family penicillin-binding protein